MTLVVESLGQALLHSVWQIIIITCTVYAINKCIPRTRANLRYVVTTLGLYAIPICFAVTFFIAFNSGGDVSVAYNAHIVHTRSLSWLVMLWSGGVMFGLVKLSLDTRGVRQLSRENRSHIDPATDQLFKALCVKMRLSRVPEVGLSAHVSGPCTIGWLKPIVLIPVNYIIGLTASELEAILAHELAHIKRHDYAHRYLQSIIHTLFFYHPCVYYLSKQAAKDREYACDDLAQTYVLSRKTLASALVKTGLWQAGNALVLNAVSPEVTEMEIRVSRLMTLANATQSAKKRPFRRILGGVVLGTAVALMAASAYTLSRPGLSPLNMSSDMSPRMSKIALIALKDDICATLNEDNIYHNPTYDPGGMARLHFMGKDVFMNKALLPSETRNTLRGIMQNHGLSQYPEVRLRYYRNEIKLLLQAPALGSGPISTVYMLENESDQLTRFNLSQDRPAS